MTRITTHPKNAANVIAILTLAKYPLDRVDFSIDDYGDLQFELNQYDLPYYAETHDAYTRRFFRMVRSMEEL